LILIGESDPLSPVSGVRIIQDFLRRVYDVYDAGSHFETVIVPNLAHQYTSDMFAAMLDWFNRFL